MVGFLGPSQRRKGPEHAACGWKARLESSEPWVVPGDSRFHIFLFPDELGGECVFSDSYFGDPLLVLGASV